MKKGDRVEISESARYNGTGVKWAEIETHEVQMKKGDRVYHKSENKIKEFLSVETSFSITEFNESCGYMYVGILKKDIMAQGYYNDDEIRIEIDSNIIEIRYLGTRKMITLDTKHQTRCGGWIKDVRYRDNTISISKKL